MMLRMQVVFPEYLNMDPYTTSASLSIDPNQPISMRPARTAGTSLPAHLYRIASVIVHFGSHSNGHYVSYRRRPRSSRTKSLSNDWFRISDEDIDPANVNEVLGANPFMLFYERVESGKIDSGEQQAEQVDKKSSIIEAWEMLRARES